MTLQTGIFGYPIGHSISPEMHRAAFASADIKGASYTAWEMRPEDLPKGIVALSNDGYRGANVTVPHKQAVMAHLDEIDPDALEIGAVNTIVNQDGWLYGTNTDAGGFIKSLRAESGFDPNGADATLIGAGGAARAAAFALAKAGVRTLTIANRTPERADALASEIIALGVSASGIGLDSPQFPNACANAGLIVNSSSVGMLGGPAPSASPVPPGAIGRGCVVYDMVYNPLETPLLSQAADAGAQTVGGLPMLVHQGAAAWSLWTEKEAPVDVMFEAARDALGNSYWQVGADLQGHFGVGEQSARGLRLAAQTPSP